MALKTLFFISFLVCIRLLSQCNLEDFSLEDLGQDQVNIYEIAQVEESILLQFFSAVELYQIKEYVRLFAPLYSLDELKLIPGMAIKSQLIHCLFYIGRLKAKKSNALSIRNYYSTDFDGNMFWQGRARFKNIEFKYQRRHELRWKMAINAKCYQIHAGYLKVRFGQGLLLNHYQTFLNDFSPDLIRRYKPSIGLGSTADSNNFVKGIYSNYNYKAFRINSICYFTEGLSALRFAQHYQYEMNFHKLSFIWLNANQSFNYALNYDYLFNPSTRLIVAGKLSRASNGLLGFEKKWKLGCRTYHYTYRKSAEVSSQSHALFSSDKAEQGTYHALCLGDVNRQITAFVKQSGVFEAYHNQRQTSIGFNLQFRFSNYHFEYRWTQRIGPSASHRHRIFWLLMPYPNLKLMNFLYINKGLYSYNSYCRTLAQYNIYKVRFQLEQNLNGAQAINFGGINLWNPLPGQYDYIQFEAFHRLYKMKFSYFLKAYRIYLSSVYNQGVMSFFLGLKQDLILVPSFGRK